MLNQALAIANGKGGVGKTSITANLAVMAAQSGLSTLAIDLDPQGNLGADLGYRQFGRSDEGRALSKAVQFEEPLVPPIEQIRPNLDAVPAGRRTRELAEVLNDRGPDIAAKAMDAALAPLSRTYDLIVFDCPPGDTMLGDLGLAMSRGLVIPIKPDAASMDGLEIISQRLAKMRSRGINPDLLLLGIALFDLNPSATVLRQQIEDEINRDFPDGVKIFSSAIRHSQRAAYDMRQHGMAATEYQRVAAVDRSRRLEMLKKDRDQLRRAGPAMSQAAAGLAADYTALCNEILEVFASSAVTIVDTDDMPIEDRIDLPAIEVEHLITRAPTPFESA